jgi:hypothetical protein
MSFIKGDKVVCIESDHWSILKKGQTYIVESTLRDGKLREIILEGIPSYSWMSRRFVLEVKSAP